MSRARSYLAVFVLKAKEAFPGHSMKKLTGEWQNDTQEFESNQKNLERELMGRAGFPAMQLNREEYSTSGSPRLDTAQGCLFLCELRSGPLDTTEDAMERARRLTNRQ